MSNEVSSVSLGVGSSSTQQSQNVPPGLKDKLVSAGLSSDEADKLISQGRDAVIAYAQSHNISLPQPPSQSSQNIFENSSSSSESSEALTNLANSGGVSAPTEIKEALIGSGMSEDEVEELVAQGPDAVMTYAQQHNIELPEPPAKPDKTLGSKFETIT